jgi:hypothetical protein
MTQLVVLVTGSRFYDDGWAIKRVLDDVTSGEQADELVIRHGACYPRRDPKTGRIPARSADWLTHLWIARFGPGRPVRIAEQERPADWEAPCRPSCTQRTHRHRNVEHRKPRGTGTYCPMAGHHRNRDMVLEDPRPGLGIAFLRDNSSGTDHCVRTMREFGIHVEEIPYQPTTPTPTRTE